MTKKTTIYLVRHGESLSNTEDKISSSFPGPELTREGREEARKLGDELLSKKIKKQIYSPYLIVNKSGSAIAQFYPSVELPKLEVSTPFTFLHIPKENKWVFSLDKNGWWNPAGGHMENNENEMDALRREAMEEAGVKIENIRLVGYAKINRVLAKDDKYPERSIIPFYVSDVLEWEDEWIRHETLDRKKFSVTEARRALCARADNGQMAEIFDYINNCVV